MTSSADSVPIWHPSDASIADANITRFHNWVESRHGIAIDDYQALWDWSVADIEIFWTAIWDFFDVGDRPPAAVLGQRTMPGAEWFPGSRLNFAQQVLARQRRDAPAILHYDEVLNERTWSGQELTSAVLELASAMRRAGVGVGDMVVACMPNRPETMIAMLATASVGATWSVVSPETGVHGAAARFSQLAPKLLFAVDAYRFRGKVVDCSAQVQELANVLASLDKVVILPLGTDPVDLLAGKTLTWEAFSATGEMGDRLEQFDFAAVPFDHPLWVLFSSGTTGLPKAMKHSHGGIILEMLKSLSLHLDLRADDRLFFYTITGWMIWNIALGALITGATTILYDGHPSHPDVGQLWRVAERSGATIFGASPSYIKTLMQAEYEPGHRYDLSRVRSVLLSGSPASPECMRWLLDAVKPDLWIQSASGGTDVCTSFVGGVPVLPVYAGEIQASWLGVDAAAFDADGTAIIDRVGELVIRQPMPSMPIGLVNDPDDGRYRQTYFETYPGVWRQGDFVLFNARGGSYVLGRSDATLNRNGVRIGTGEIYSALEQIPAVADALVMEISQPDGESWMPLLVKLADDAVLEPELEDLIRRHLRGALSPRHVPDEIIHVPGIPYTKTGKRLEVPLRRILSGLPLEQTIAREAIEDFALIEAVAQITREKMDAARSRVRNG